MTTEMIAALIPAAAAVVMTAMLCAAALAAWRGWLGYKQLQLAAVRAGDGPSDEQAAQPDADMGVRIELAAVKDRLRKLEAIASGVEL